MPGDRGLRRRVLPLWACRQTLALLAGPSVFILSTPRFLFSSLLPPSLSRCPWLAPRGHCGGGWRARGRSARTSLAASAARPHVGSTRCRCRGGEWARGRLPHPRVRVEWPLQRPRASTCVGRSLDVRQLTYVLVLVLSNDWLYTSCPHAMRALFRTEHVTYICVHIQCAKAIHEMHIYTMRADDAYTTPSMRTGDTFTADTMRTDDIYTAYTMRTYDTYTTYTMRMDYIHTGHAMRSLL